MALGWLRVMALAIACSTSSYPLGRRDDQPALALADRADQVDDPGGQRSGVGFEPQSLLRMQRGELGEVRAVESGCQAVDGVDGDERAVLLAGTLRPAVPLTTSPVRRPSFRTWASETYTSVGPGR